MRLPLQRASPWAYCLAACWCAAAPPGAEGFVLRATHRGPRPRTRGATERDGARAFPRVGAGLGARPDDDDDEPPAPANDRDIFGRTEEQRNRPPDEDLGEIRGPDRLKSCIPYVLPLIDGDAFGSYLYERVPPLGALDYVFLRPIVDGCHAAPLLIIVLFAAFALGPRLTNQSREVRFNAQQAVLLDVALLVPNLIAEAVGETDGQVPRAVLEPASTLVWYALATAVAYCVTSNLRGKKPDGIPFVSGVAEYAIGPY